MNALIVWSLVLVSIVGLCMTLLLAQFLYRYCSWLRHHRGVGSDVPELQDLESQYTNLNLEEEEDYFGCPKDESEIVCGKGAG